MQVVFFVSYKFKRKINEQTGTSKKNYSWSFFAWLPTPKNYFKKLIIV
jgi:hypothetical protein